VLLLCDSSCQIVHINNYYFIFLLFLNKQIVYIKQNIIFFYKFIQLYNMNKLQLIEQFMDCFNGLFKKHFFDTFGIMSFDQEIILYINIYNK